MHPLLNTIYNSIRKDSGFPVSLMRLLEQHPDIRVELSDPAPCIAAASVVPWHELGTPPVLDWPRRNRGDLTGWKATGDHYESFQLHRPEYDQIGQREIMDNWVCDITDVHGFSTSKSELRDFTSTDKMVETNSRDMIDEISHAKLTKNLAHSEIRIIHTNNTTDHFTRYLWDGRLFLMNNGGSHHFAAAKYIAARLPENVTLRGKLYTYSLNAIAIASLRRDYEMFVISDKTDISCAFDDAMRAFKATWLWHHIPRPYENAKAILLPKSEARSMRVAAALRQAGVVDLGIFLDDLAASQSKISTLSNYIFRPTG
ncbi:DUF6685 family protein [Sulfuriferula sp. AH1]|uniref:DUF6685 family protein n=1 Tax=Sulfuriferula sp. AH1 TaxID=1985873 RepID=UPI0016739A9B|nr:DUF6685 family protein [Sulfuriferula sp. AH1]